MSFARRERRNLSLILHFVHRSLQFFDFDLNERGDGRSPESKEKSRPTWFSSDSFWNFSRFLVSSSSRCWSSIFSRSIVEQRWRDLFKWFSNWNRGVVLHPSKIERFYFVQRRFEFFQFAVVRRANRTELNQLKTKRTKLTNSTTDLNELRFHCVGVVLPTVGNRSEKRKEVQFAAKTSRRTLVWFPSASVSLIRSRNVRFCVRSVSFSLFNSWFFSISWIPSSFCRSRSFSSLRSFIVNLNAPSRNDEPKTAERTVSDFLDFEFEIRRIFVRCWTTLFASVEILRRTVRLDKSFLPISPAPNADPVAI